MLVLLGRVDFVPQDVDVEQHQVVACGVEHPPQAPEPQVGPPQHVSHLKQHLQDNRVLPAWCWGRHSVFRVYFVQFRFAGCCCCCCRQFLLLLIPQPVKEQGAFRPREAQGEQHTEADEAQRYRIEGVEADVANGHAQLAQHRAGEHAQEHRGAGVSRHALVEGRTDQGEDVGGVGHAAGHGDAVEELHELHLQEAGAQEQNEPDDHLADALDDQHRLVAHQIRQQERRHQHHHVGVRQHGGDLIGHLGMTDGWDQDEKSTGKNV